VIEDSVYLAEKFSFMESKFDKMGLEESGYFGQTRLKPCVRVLEAYRVKTGLYNYNPFLLN